MTTEESRRPIVVCVDDQSEVLSAIRRALRREPYEVWTTNSAREALDWVTSHGISVIIADHRMPEILGIALMAAVRERSPRTARVVLTGYPGEESIRQSLDDADDAIQYLIGKPWSDDALRLTLREIIERQRTPA